MNINIPAVHLTPQNGEKKLLKEQVKKIIISQNLDNQRRLIKAIASELKISVLDCAAAMAVLSEKNLIDKNASSGIINAVDKPLPTTLQPVIKFIRYRLDVGNQHALNLIELKKILVEESGVDVKNIANVRIQDTYTLIDLPDEMPQEIFHHLKSVELNGRKLDIRRVKPRNKKKNTRRYKNPKMASQPAVMN
ncbi:MAG: DbpA RNA binding domain-containing protein [Methylococcaceae bacterium]|nr:DbpA RNA binding domain-containing protein [Methylococcaceae bacterium]